MIQTLIFFLNYLNKTVEFTTNFIFFSAIIYTLITLFLTYLILSIAKKNKNIKYISLIKNWEYIQFKNNIFNTYYSSLIILFIFLFKNNYLSLSYLLEFNLYFIFYLFFFILCALSKILLNNYFIIFLFKFYLEIKKYIQILSEIQFIYYKNNK